MPAFTHKAGAKMVVGVRNMITKSRLKKVNEGLTAYQKRSRLPHTTLSIFDETVIVPLLFSGFNIKSKIVSDQVRSIDIFPYYSRINWAFKKTKISRKKFVAFF